jgi:hypothetical protein
MSVILDHFFCHEIMYAVINIAFNFIRYVYVLSVESKLKELSYSNDSTSGHLCRLLTTGLEIASILVGRAIITARFRSNIPPASKALPAKLMVTQTACNRC